jgi:tetratricopeptide (TPR) repeat protein
VTEEARPATPPSPSAMIVAEEPVFQGQVGGVAISDAVASSSELDEVVAIGYRNRSNKNKEIVTGSTARNASQPVIQLAPIKQDNVYTKQLTGKLDNDYTVYLKLRPEYINTPTFYFDVADWFFRHNDRERALRILTSIADLDLENASLFRLLGYRLKEYKEYALEAYVCKKVIQWRPMEPQSYRDYALALADNGNYQAALDSLFSILTQSYAQNIGQRSQGIEEVVVTEINQVITQNPKLRTGNIPKELIQAMPVDIRVVINWNMNSTDIDLHVTDPNGETCYYSHRETALGGRISRDITQGYGPEQFLLKKAIKGKYGVFINYYGDSQVKAEGPSTVMAEIYTRYADKSEQRQVVCLQLSKENRQTDGKMKVAEFSF